MSTWFKRILAALALGFAGAIIVPFLSIEVYRLLLRLGVDDYQILIRLSNKFQTPAEFFAMETVVFGATLGVGSGYMLVMQFEKRLREVWILSTICSSYAFLLLYAILCHLIYVVLGKQKRIDGLPLMLTSFSIPAIWSLALFLWGYKVYGAKSLKAKKWNKQQVRSAIICAVVITLVNAVSS